ncbi:hypothetical protein [Deinococcus misasensis]|uniref:hypothetical protein n=1 Tax=Deinococcus misasensis TaxID=392413 RepID=UPI000552651D|nr:hypothetical protein [Deinococcus misasensis]
MHYKITCPKLLGLCQDNYRRTPHENKALETLEVIFTLIKVADSLEQLFKALRASHITDDGKLVLVCGKALRLQASAAPKDRPTCLVIERLILESV